MKKNYIILMFILVLVISACQSEEGGNNKKMEKKETINVTEQEETMSPAEYLNVLIHEEKDGDGKSVYWDGEKASVKEDPYDVKDMDDGRFTIEGKQTVSIPQVYQFEYPDSLQNAVVEKDSEEFYHITAQDFDICIELIDYDEREKILNDEDNYEIVEDEILSKNQTKYFKRYALYRGVVDADGKDYAGFVLIFESGLADRSYQISCSGIGYMKDIQINSTYIMNHFDVLFY